MRKANKKLNPLQNQTLGDAHFATPDEVQSAGLVTEKGIRLGYYKAPEDRSEGWGKIIRYGGDAHLITVAPTRSGKGRDVLIPALLEYPGSCIVIDPKGQLAAVTKTHRGRPVAQGGLGQEIIVLNPFNLLEEELGSTAHYNPMVTLDPQSDSFGSDCDSLADAIIANDNRGDSHWPDSARQLVSGIVMHLAASGEVEFKNLASVRSVVSGPVAELNGFIAEALEADRSGDGFITGRLARFENINDESREMLGIISSAITQTGFIGNKAISKSLRGSDFRFRDLKRKPTTVYLILPANQVASCGKWFRLVIASALADLWSETRGAVPVLAILDEFAQLGRLQAIENAMGLAAGFGLQLWPVLQNLTQLKRDYGDNWETFLGSAAVRQFFAPQDDFTAEYVSRMCGVKTVVTQGQSLPHAAELLEKSRASTSWGQQSLPLLHPHNIRGLGPQECLILGPRNTVIDAFRRSYLELGELQGLYSADPYHRTPIARSAGDSFAGLQPPTDGVAAKESARAHGRKEGTSWDIFGPRCFAFLRKMAWSLAAVGGVTAAGGFGVEEWLMNIPLRKIDAETYKATNEGRGMSPWQWKTEVITPRMCDDAQYYVADEYYYLRNYLSGRDPVRDANWIEVHSHSWVNRFFTYMYGSHKYVGAGLDNHYRHVDGRPDPRDPAAAPVLVEMGTGDRRTLKKAKPVVVPVAPRPNMVPPSNAMSHPVVSAQAESEEVNRHFFDYANVVYTDSEVRYIELTEVQAARIQRGIRVDLPAETGVLGKNIRVVPIRSSMLGTHITTDVGSENFLLAEVMGGGLSGYFYVLVPSAAYADLKNKH